MNNDQCYFCEHSLRSHNVHQFDGPVCMLCGCGDQYVVEERPRSVWRRDGVFVVLLLGAMAVIITVNAWVQYLLTRGNP